MDGSQFDAWTRRRFGLAAGGTLATLFGLLHPDEADSKNKHRRRRRKRKQKQKRREKRRDNNQPQPCQGVECDYPDIILIYVDDMREEDFVALPRTTARLADQGATYPNYFMTTPLCAPSRASFFRGQYAHNHGVRNNQDGWGVFNGINENTIATWLRGANPSYRTAHIGKHINGYNAAQNQIGPGWTDWIVPVPVAFYDYDLNVNGEIEPHPGNKNKDYLTDVLKEKAQDVITTTPEETPLFLYFAPKAPHGPSTPANRHEGDFVDAELDQGGSFNEADMSDKPTYMQRPELSQADINALQESNQLRLESLLAVDEAVESLVETLDAAGRLGNAYIFFVTDNGYLLGQHRRSGKNVPYEEAIRMSMLVRGPGIDGGQTIDAMVANIDLAPTFAELAGVAPPGYVDGRSIVETFDGSANDRQALLIEIFPAGAEPDPEEEEITAEARLLEVQAEPTSARRAIRIEGWLYVEHGGTGERELYDLNDDPFQLESLHDDPDQSDRIQELSNWLATLRDCDAANCRTAENGPPV